MANILDNISDFMAKNKFGNVNQFIDEKGKDYDLTSDPYSNKFNKIAPTAENPYGVGAIQTGVDEKGTIRGTTAPITTPNIKTIQLMSYRELELAHIIPEGRNFPMVEGIKIMRSMYASLSHDLIVEATLVKISGSENVVYQFNGFDGSIWYVPTCVEKKYEPIEFEPPEWEEYNTKDEK